MQEPDSRKYLDKWIEYETRKLDLIASWETLCGTYQSLGFKDDLSDSMMLEEFKWIIHEMNRFLARMRKTLSEAKNIDGAMISLQNVFGTADNVTINSRKAVAFHKLRQQWIRQSIIELGQLSNELEDEQNEEVENA